MKYDEIYQQFVGKGKIQALGVYPSAGEEWVLRYKEGSTSSEVTCETREVLDRILVEFGGRNPETCRAPDHFLNMNGSWTSDDLNDLGHRIVKAKLEGSRVVRSTVYPIPIPDDCGTPTVVHARHKKPGKLIKLKLSDRESVVFTLAFNEPADFDNLCQFLLTHDALKSLKWTVKILATEARETGDQCIWKRLRAGDGTKRMVLELIGLNGRHYTECVRQELFNAAGDMFYSPCQRVAVKKKEQQTLEICMFAAEDGKFDMSRYEAVSN